MLGGQWCSHLQWCTLQAMVDPESGTISVVLYQLVVAAQVDKQGTGLNAEIDNWTAQVSLE